jgi:predicted glycosyltransferase
MGLSVFIAVTHLLGVGHLSRAAAIGRALARAGHKVTLASGGNPAPLVRTDGLTLVQLPPVHCRGTDFRTLLNLDGSVAGADVLAERRRALVAAFESARPDVVITELFPFGRRQLADEFLALLEAARIRRPRPAVLCSIRDILNPPSRPERAGEALERLGAYYDRVLVHGDPAVTPLAVSWPTTPPLERRLVYTGFIAESTPALSGDGGPGAGEVLVSGGGSAASLPLFEAALGAAALLRDGPHWRILVGGGVPADSFEDLRRRAPSSATVERARPDFPALLAQATVSVSQAGDNTMADLALTRTRAVVVPFEQGGEAEQRLRAEALARSGRAVMLAETELSPETLARAVEQAGEMALPERRIDLGGLAATVQAVQAEAARAASRERALTRLRVALDRLDAAGKRITVWWRDDDAIDATPQLDTLLSLSEELRLPLALAVIPAAVQPALADALDRVPGVEVLQHGWSHANHAPAGAKKRELGDTPLPLLLTELATGHRRLSRQFGPRFVPILVPPWNMIDPRLVPHLAEEGFIGLSVFGPAAKVEAMVARETGRPVLPSDGESGSTGRMLGWAAALVEAAPLIGPAFGRSTSPSRGEGSERAGPGVEPEARRETGRRLPVLNTHFDPIDWRGGGGLRPEAELLDVLADRVEASLADAPGSQEPYGILTHHLVHDGWVWRFCREILAMMSARSCIHFVRASQMVEQITLA